MKNNIDVFYFSGLIPLNIFFVEDGKMGEFTRAWLCRRGASCSRIVSASRGPLVPPEGVVSIAVALLIFHCPSAAERQVFLATWKDIPNENELQYQIKECHLNAGRFIFLVGSRPCGGFVPFYSAVISAN